MERVYHGELTGVRTWGEGRTGQGLREEQRHDPSYIYLCKNKIKTRADAWKEHIPLNGGM